MRISKIKLQEKTIEVSNLVLIVGPNNSGKSTLLYETFTDFIKSIKNTAFWGDIEFEWTTGEEDKKLLVGKLQEAQREERTQPSQPDTTYYYNPYSKYGAFEPAKAHYEEILSYPLQVEDGILLNEMADYLQVEERFNLGYSKQFNLARTQKRKDDLDLIFFYQDFKDKVGKKILDYINKRIYISFERFPQGELLTVSKLEVAEPSLDLQNIDNTVEKIKSFIGESLATPLQREGHGIKALVKIFLSILKPTNDILFIDEPELHLYPSVKRKLGKDFGEMASRDEKQIICVTHDADFIQGIFDSRCDPTIIRVSADARGSTLKFSKFNTRDVRPAGNEENYLQIAFLDFAIGVEGPADRLVYEYVATKINASSKEYKFIAVHGAGQAQNMETISKPLGVRVAYIFDFDVLKNENKQIKILKIIEGLNLPPSLSRDANIQELASLLKDTKVKTEGVNCLSGQALELANSVITELKEHGIFIVPIGKLESWFTDKTVNEFIEGFTEQEDNYKDLQNFIKEVISYAEKSLL